MGITTKTLRQLFTASVRGGVRVRSRIGTFGQRCRQFEAESVALKPRAVWYPRHLSALRHIVLGDKVAGYGMKDRPCALVLHTEREKHIRSACINAWINITDLQNFWDKELQQHLPYDNLIIITYYNYKPSTISVHNHLSIDRPCIDKNISRYVYRLCPQLKVGNCWSHLLRRTDTLATKTYQNFTFLAISIL